jgi:mitochondrial translocator assembly and maintenance protein 41
MNAVAEEDRAAELAGPLRDLLPPVDFCCAYGSTLLHARPDGTSMVDYIIGVADPLQWHSEVLGTPLLSFGQSIRQISSYP